MSFRPGFSTNNFLQWWFEDIATINFLQLLSLLFTEFKFLPVLLFPSVLVEIFNSCFSTVFIGGKLVLEVPKVSNNFICWDDVTFKKKSPEIMLTSNSADEMSLGFLKTAVQFLISSPSPIGPKFEVQDYRMSQRRLLMPYFFVESPFLGVTSCLWADF